MDSGLKGRTRSSRRGSRSRIASACGGRGITSSRYFLGSLVSSSFRVVLSALMPAHFMDSNSSRRRGRATARRTKSQVGTTAFVRTRDAHILSSSSSDRRRSRLVLAAATRSIFSCLMATATTSAGALTPNAASAALNAALRTAKWCITVAGALPLSCRAMAQATMAALFRLLSVSLPSVL